MKWRTLLVANIVSVLLSHAVSAQPASFVRIPWKLAEAASAPATATLKEEGAVPYARLVPVAPLRLTQDIRDGGKMILPKGTLMARSELGGAIFCEAVRRGGQETFKCLEDVDGDGVIDSYASVWATEYYVYSHMIHRQYLMETLPPFNRHDLKGDLKVSILEDDPDAEGVSLEIRLLFNRETYSQFTFCGVSRRGSRGFCNQDFKVPVSEFGKAQPYYGGSITVVGRDDSHATVSISRPTVESRIN